MKKRRNAAKSGSGSRLYLLLGLLVALTLAALWSSAKTTDPADALHRALLSLDTNEAKNVEPLLAVARQDDATKDWAVLVLARLREEQGDFAKALEAYRAVSPTSAASLEARLGILRLASINGDADLGQRIAQLEPDLRSAGRADLLPELSYIRAEQAEKAGDTVLALDLYRRIRRKDPKSELALRARAAMLRISAAEPEASGTEAVGPLLDEAALLLPEGEPVKALEKVQHAKALTAPNSQAHIEAMLLEEKILRKLRRAEEADHTLLLVSAEGVQGTADAAMLQIAKNAWNENNNHQALEIIANLKKRFPASPLLEEALYVEARLLEELNLLLEAKDAYIALSKTAKDPLRQTIALKRLAWMYFRNDNLMLAANFFEQARHNAEANLDKVRKLYQAEADLETAARKEDLGTLRRTILNLTDERNHCLFWLARALQSLPVESKKELQIKSRSAEALLKTLLQSDPAGYYGMLAARELKEPLPETLINAAPLRPGCMLSIPEARMQVFSLLSAAQLEEFARAEIDWMLSRIPSGKSNFASPLMRDAEDFLDPELIKLYTTRALLHLDYGSIDSAIGLAENLSNQARLGIAGERGEVVTNCLNVLRDAAFPMPYRPTFEAAAAKEAVALELLYAIARTESHFNPRALSSAGAQGLTQLMPKTAEAEGLKPEQSLFEPSVNVELGAKHFAKLLGEYDREPVYAIAAYNAGRAAVNRWRARYQNLDPITWAELIGYPETLNYVRKVQTAQAMYAARVKAVSAPK